MRITEQLQTTIWRMLKDYSPVQNTSYRLIKTCFCPSEELKKYKVLTKPEEFGSNYLFWCWMDVHQKEPFFLFGQCTIYQGELYFGVEKNTYAIWAKSAYKRKWIDKKDIREVFITFRQENSVVQNG